VRRASGHLDATVHDEVVLLHATEGTYFGLNNTGTRIWDLIRVASSLHDIADVLSREYDVEREQAARDVSNIIGELLQCGLAEVVSQGRD
jgi:hypothetical protein